MPPWYFTVMELCVFALAITLAPHAKKQGWQWVSTYACGVVFGTTIELLLVSRATASYHYGEFLVMLGPAGKEVPLWVGVGWGAILYAATWTAFRMKLPRLLRPLGAGVLAVNIDLSLDPIAHHLGYWVWRDPGPINLYDVPFDNFLGWFAIVASYSFFVREGFDRFRPETSKSYLWVPPLAVFLALGVMIGIQKVVGVLYSLPGGQTATFVFVFGFSCILAWKYAVHSRRNQPFSWQVLAVPVVMHGLLWFLLFATGTYSSQLLTSLIVLIPLNLFVGVFAYGWVSLDRLFPVPQTTALPAAAAAPASEQPADAARAPVVP